MMSATLRACVLSLLGAACVSAAPPTPQTTTTETSLAALFPADLVADEGLVLVMFANEQCGGAVAFRPTFVAAPSWLPGVRHRVVDITPAMLESLQVPLPLFVLFRDGRPIDIHAGIDQVATAQGTTFGVRTFAALAVRNGLSEGAAWSLATAAWPVSSSYHHASIKFVAVDALAGAGMDFRRAMISESRLPRANFAGARFEQTIMAHVDLTDATLTDEQAKAIVWVNSTCPDGTSSRRHGDTCVGHTVAVR
jgi:hypothetical protein